MQTHDHFKGLKHFAGLDGVRCFAAILVVWHHSEKFFPHPLLMRGHLGVDVFFVLSGFLISTLLLREKEMFGRISLRDFWARRSLRLFPAYFALLAFMACFYLIFRQGDESARRFFSGLPVYIAYLSNWVQPGANSLGHTWTLATEEQFYVVWPLIEAFARPFVLALTWLTAFLLNQALNFGFFDTALRQAGLMGEGRLEIAEVTFSPILLGVALAHLLHRRQSFDRIGKVVAWRGAEYVCAASILAILTLGPASLDGVPRLAVHLLITAIIAAIVIRPTSSLTRMLDRPSFAYLGRISYGIYLYHLLVLGFAIPLLGSAAGVWSFPVGLTITILISALSYLILEQPLLRLGKRFRQVPLSRDDAEASKIVAPLAHEETTGIDHPGRDAALARRHPEAPLPVPVPPPSGPGRSPAG